MTELIFASSNEHKAKEIAVLLPTQYQIKTMREAGFRDEIPEPFESLEENSLHKASVISHALNCNCFAEDTGLETDALSGAPGVLSARFAGEPPNPEKNMEKLLFMLQDKPNRAAQFKTVITLILGGATYQFTGICKGRITAHPTGTAGFGYDPVFIPDGSERTFAEMTMEEKNQYSHRKKALAKMIIFLNGRESISA